MTGAVKETASQRIERIKREKAPWSIMDDIRRYAREGFASIPADDLGVRFRSWGLYTQGDGGGTRGEEMPFFMMRVRTPNGLLTSEMVKTIAYLSDKYARSSIDITNRQNVQLIKHNGGTEVEGFDVFVGGGLGANSGIARTVGFRTPSQEVPDALERLFRQYDATREPTEIFRAWASRVGDKGIHAILSDAGSSMVTS